YELDGTQLNNPVFGTPSLFPSVETLQEVRVETQNFSSALSRTAGGQVLLVSKSGTNEWHGSVYEYLQNSDLNARNPFALVRPVTRSNQFGGTLGGPIIRNNTFFFVGYEGFGGIAPRTSSTTVPTDNQRQGILSDPTLDPKPIIDTLTGQPFPNNIIPSNRLSPIALNVLKLTPIPNFQIANYASGFDGFGEASGTPIASKIRHFEISDNMTLVKSSHTLAWGGSYTRAIIMQLSSQQERGQYTFDGSYTGDSLADF